MNGRDGTLVARHEGEKMPRARQMDSWWYGRGSSPILCLFDYRAKLILFPVPDGFHSGSSPGSQLFTIHKLQHINKAIVELWHPNCSSPNCLQSLPKFVESLNAKCGFNPIKKVRRF